MIDHRSVHPFNQKSPKKKKKWILKVLFQLLNCSFSGGGEQHAGALQVSRNVGFVRAEDVLEGRPGLPNGRQDPEGPFQERGPRGSEQPRQRDAADEGAGLQAAAAGSSAASPEEAASRQQQQQQPASGQKTQASRPRQAAILLSEVAEFLRERPDGRHTGHCGPEMQQNEPERRRVRVPLLRTGIQRRQTTPDREVPVQVSLVLLRPVPKLHRRGMDNRVQVNYLFEKKIKNKQKKR